MWLLLDIEKLDGRDGRCEGHVAPSADEVPHGGCDGEGVTVDLALDEVGSADDERALVVADVGPITAVGLPRVGLDDLRDELDDLVDLLLFGESIGVVAGIAEDGSATATATAAAAAAATAAVATAAAAEAK